MRAFGKEIGTGYRGGDLTAGVWNLSQTSEGHLYPCKADEFSSSAHADIANREVMSVMGFRVFYGQHPDGHVIEFIKKGRIGQKDMAKIRELNVTRLWTSTFVAKTWLIDGKERMTKYSVDLSPKETTREAMRWGRAMGMNPVVQTKGLTPAERRKTNKLLHEHVSSKLHDSIPFSAIEKILAMQGLVILQEDNTRFEGFLTGSSAQTHFEVGRTSSMRIYRGGTCYIPLSNSLLSMSWYRYNTGRYEVLVYLT